MKKRAFIALLLLTLLPVFALPLLLPAAEAAGVCRVDAGSSELV